MFRTNDVIYKKNLKKNMILSVAMEGFGILMMILALTNLLSDLRRNFHNGDVLGFILMFCGIVLIVYPLVILTKTLQHKKFFEETGLEVMTVEEFQRWKATGRISK